MMIVIPRRFPGLNEFVDANRRQRGRWNAGNSMKQKDQREIILFLPKVVFKNPIYLEYHFYEPNSRRDKDNVSGYFHKIFQDALVQSGVIPNDGWKQIEGWADFFSVDKAYPRVEIYIEEIKKNEGVKSLCGRGHSGTRIGSLLDDQSG